MDHYVRRSSPFAVETRDRSFSQRAAVVRPALAKPRVPTAAAGLSVVGEIPTHHGEALWLLTLEAGWELGGEALRASNRLVVTLGRLPR